MVLIAGGAMLLLAGVFSAVTVVVMRRQWRDADARPLLRWGDTITAMVFLLRVVTAGGLFGFGLAMILDHWFGWWGLLLAITICAAVGVTVCRVPMFREEG